MPYLEVALVGLGMIAVGWSVELARSVVRRKALSDTDIQVGREPERDALFHAVVRQQRSAFGLFWFSISIVIMLSALLVGRVLTADRIDYAFLLNAASTIAAILLAFFANHLYRQSTERLNSIITMVARQTSISHPRGQD